MSQQLLDHLLHEIDGVRVTHPRSNRIRADVKSEALPTLLELLKGRAGYVHLSAISCVDWIDEEEFELVYHLWSYEVNTLVSAHIRIPREPGLYVSIFDLYQPAYFFERDIHEMYGVFFEGSPDMAKFILTEWDGPPPMRKEFDSEKFVMETFSWQLYQPDWLTELEQQGGGIVLRPEDVRR
jgi:NADH-quinone oxidoreductase subunit C